MIVLEMFEEGHHLFRSLEQLKIFETSDIHCGGVWPRSCTTVAKKVSPDLRSRKVVKEFQKAGAEGLSQYPSYLFDDCFC